jgi:hypothetical protein
VKIALKGKRVQDAEYLKKNVAVELNAVPLEAFFNCFKDTCIKAGGNNT